MDEWSITGLYARVAVILVTKGNPKGVRTLGDLTRQGMKVMVVTQEKMEEVYQARTRNPVHRLPSLCSQAQELHESGRPNRQSMPGSLMNRGITL